MKILKEGDKEKAWHRDLGKLVEVSYQRRKIYIRSEDVEVVTLVGVHLESDTWLVIPPQSAPEIGEAIRAKEAREARTAAPATLDGPALHSI